MFTFIGPGELINYMENNEVIIVDVRDEEDFENEHIHGAVNIPYAVLMKNSSRINRNKKILLYCDKGNLSLKAALKLDKEGINVMSLHGGISGIKSFYPY